MASCRKSDGRWIFTTTGMPVGPWDEFQRACIRARSDILLAGHTIEITQDQQQGDT